jgi:hypothetical protein
MAGNKNTIGAQMTLMDEFRQGSCLCGSELARDEANTFNIDIG